MQVARHTETFVTDQSLIMKMQVDVGSCLQEVVRNTWKAVLAKEERGFANERLFQ